MKPPIKKYKAELLGCGDHPNGCYIKLENELVEHSEEQTVLLEFDKNDNLVGIDLQEDLKFIKYGLEEGIKLKKETNKNGNIYKN